MWLKNEIFFSTAKGTSIKKYAEGKRNVIIKKDSFWDFVCKFLTKRIDTNVLS